MKSSTNITQYDKIEMLENKITKLQILSELKKDEDDLASDEFNQVVVDFIKRETNSNRFYIASSWNWEKKRWITVYNNIAYIRTNECLEYPHWYNDGDLTALLALLCIFVMPISLFIPISWKLIGMGWTVVVPFLMNKVHKMSISNFKKTLRPLTKGEYNSIITTIDDKLNKDIREIENEYNTKGLDI